MGLISGEEKLHTPRPSFLELAFARKKNAQEAARIEETAAEAAGAESEAEEGASVSVVTAAAVAR